MLGLIYNQKEEYQKAIEYCDTAISIAPRKATAYAHRGFAYLMSGQIERAIVDLEKSKDISSGYEKVYFYLACFYATNNDSEQAIKNLETAYTYGFNRPHWITWIEKEESLSSIRNNADYKTLITTMKENLNSLN